MISRNGQLVSLVLISIIMIPILLLIVVVIMEDVGPFFLKGEDCEL